MVAKEFEHEALIAFFQFRRVIMAFGEQKFYILINVEDETYLRQTK